MILTTLEDTKAQAAIIAAKLKSGDVLTLSGDLGAGKTTFAGYVIQTLMQDPNLPVLSPTYTLLETYEMPNGQQIWHYDAYRLEQPGDIMNTGYEDGLAIGAIMLIEWPERIALYLPAHHKAMQFQLLNDGSRCLVYQ
jgi:tRNA threonylcarbamoyl adenosine modification protein YjeE